MTASSCAHGITASIRVRNFSRRVVFFLAANSAWAKLGGCVMPHSLSQPRAAVASKSMQRV